MPAIPGTWRINYQGPISTDSVDYHILDLFDFSDSDVQQIVNQGAMPIAYFSAHLENWRTDAKRFTGNDVLRQLGNWSNEFYVMPSTNTKQIMADRLQMAVDKGFQGVDVDNLDAHLNGVYQDILGPGNNGHSIGQDYIQWFIDECSNVGLQFGLKNCQMNLPLFGSQVDFFVSEDPPTVNQYQSFNKPAVLMNYTGTSVSGPVFNLFFANQNDINGGSPTPIP